MAEVVEQNKLLVRPHQMEHQAVVQLEQAEVMVEVLIHNQMDLQQQLIQVVAEVVPEVVLLQVVLQKMVVMVDLE